MSEIELVITPLGSPVIGRRVISQTEQKQLKEDAKVWRACCSRSSKEAIIFFTQISFMSVIMIYSLVSLTFTDKDRELHMSLLSLVIGIALPSPKLK